MSVSFAQQSSMTCPHCGQPFATSVWWIIDANENPELVRRAALRALHSAVCPRGHEIEFSSPLLIHQSGFNPTVIFVPAPDANTIETQKHAITLFNMLHERLVDTWSDDLIEDRFAIASPESLIRILVNSRLGHNDVLTNALATILANIDNIRSEKQGTPHPAKTDKISALDPYQLRIAQPLSGSDMGIVSPHSFGFNIQVQCRVCGVLYPATIWSIVDITDSDELVARVLDGTLHSFRCPNDHPHTILSALLIFRPSLEPPLIFSPASSRSAPTVQEQIQPLLAQLRDSMLNTWDETLAERIVEIPAALWPATLDPSPDVIERAYRLLDEIQTWLNLGITVESLLFLVDHPRIISNSAIGIITRLEFTNKENPEAVHRLRRGRAILDQCLAEGIEGTFESFGKWLARDGGSSTTAKLLRFEAFAGCPWPLVAPLTYIYEIDPVQAQKEMPELVLRAHRYIAEHPKFHELPTIGRQAILTDTGVAFVHRFERSGDINDLSSAIVFSEQATATTEERTELWLLASENLCNYLNMRFEVTGSIDDLERSITLREQLIAFCEPGSKHYAKNVGSLGGTLTYRYQWKGAIDDLNRALLLTQEATQILQEDNMLRPMAESNLAMALRYRFEHLHQRADIDSAIIFSKRASESDVGLSKTLELTNLGLLYRKRYEHYDDATDLEAAITILDQALTVASAQSHRRPVMLTTLGHCYSDRYTHSHAISDLDKSIELLKAAVTSAVSSSRDYPRHLGVLANGLRKRFLVLGHNEDLIAAQDTYRKAIESGQTIAIASVLTGSLEWAHWAAQRQAWHEVCEAASYGIAAMEDLYRSQSLQSERELWLSTATELYSLGALALSHMGELQKAVEWAELGRARALGESLARERTALNSLEAKFPLLARAYRRAADQFAQLVRYERMNRITALAGSLMPEQPLNMQASQIRAELDASIAAIRVKPGYDRFLQPPTFQEIANTATADTPLIFLLTGQQTSVALIVSRDSEPEAVWFDGFSETVLRDLLYGEDDGALLGLLPAQLNESQLLYQALGRTLDQIGLLIATPLAERLHTLGYRGFTIIPFGRLGLIPFHSAVIRHKQQTRYMLDDFVVNYAPSARVLAFAIAEMSARRQGKIRLVGVGNPTSDLRFARAELESICDLLLPPQSEVLYEAAATSTAFWQMVSGASILHFSCHGRFANDPLDAALLLAGGTQITLRQLISSDQIGLLNDVRLVVLSACQTAITDFRHLPNESVGLPAGFLQAGVTAVIGTLWSVNDLSTALLMHRFYELYLQGDAEIGLAPQPPARALRLAQLWLRDLTYQEMFDYFEWHRRLSAARKHSDETRLVSSMTLEGREIAEEGLADDPNARPYADPVYWAGFTFNGAIEE